MSIDFSKLFNDVLQNIHTYGLSVVLLLLLFLPLLLFLWGLVIYARDKVVTPIVTHTLRLIETLTERIPQQCGKLDKLIEANNKLVEAKEHHSDKLNKLLQSSERQESSLTRIPTVITEQTAALSRAIEKQTGALVSGHGK